ncbi:MAG: hypothetical protein ABIQ73_26580 [Acidimicrobiales bacterium]
MSDRSHVDPVASGTCYVVTSVNEQPPDGLSDFIARPVVVVTVASEHQVVTIHGSARLDGDSILVYEKDSDGVGKDVRTWRIQLQNGRFEAFERSTY